MICVIAMSELLVHFDAQPPAEAFRFAASGAERLVVLKRFYAMLKASSQPSSPPTTSK
jgi:hypothetical protein